MVEGGTKENQKKWCVVQINEHSGIRVLLCVNDQHQGIHNKFLFTCFHGTIRTIYIFLLYCYVALGFSFIKSLRSKTKLFPNEYTTGNDVNWRIALERPFRAPLKISQLARDFRTEKWHSVNKRKRRDASSRRSGRNGKKVLRREGIAVASRSRN